MRRQYDGTIYGLVNPFVISDEKFVGEPKRAGIDNHAHTPDRMDGPILYLNCEFDAQGASEALKFSRHWNVTVVGGVIRGGVEDCVDIVRGGFLTFSDVTFVRGPAKQDVTLKGGALHVRFYRCPGLSKIVLGDYTKYDHHSVIDGLRHDIGLFRPLPRPPVRDVHIEACSAAVRVVRLHAKEPTGDVKVRNLNWVVKPYFYARAKFFREALPPPPEEFVIDPREL